MNTSSQSIRRCAKTALSSLMLAVGVMHFTGIAAGQEQSNERPRRPDNQSRSPGQGREREGGGGGGRREMAENNTPVSPNPGQTVGLVLNTPEPVADSLAVRTAAAELVACTEIPLLARVAHGDDPAAGPALVNALLGGTFTP